MTVSGGRVVSVKVESDTAVNAWLLVAVYEDGRLLNTEKKTVITSGETALSGNTAFNQATHTMNCFLWDDYMTPKANAYRQ